MQTVLSIEPYRYWPDSLTSTAHSALGILPQFADSRQDSLRSHAACSGMEDETHKPWRWDFGKGNIFRSDSSAVGLSSIKFVIFLSNFSETVSPEGALNWKVLHVLTTKGIQWQVDSLSLIPVSMILGRKSVRCKACRPQINRALCSAIHFGTSERNSDCLKECHDVCCNVTWLVCISKHTGSEQIFTVGLGLVYSINWNPHAATNSDNIAKRFWSYLLSRPCHHWEEFTKRTTYDSSKHRLKIIHCSVDNRSTCTCSH